MSSGQDMLTQLSLRRAAMMYLVGAARCAGFVHKVRGGGGREHSVSVRDALNMWVEGGEGQCAAGWGQVAAMC